MAFMKYFLLAVTALITLNGSVSAQTDSTKKKKDWSKVSLANRANDHFMFQFGYDNWAQKPDSIRTTGFGRHLNAYFMFDFPFKTDPRFSVGAGVGVGSSNIYFDKQEPQVAGRTQTLAFRDVSNTERFKKFKMTETWAEAPIELRFSKNPETPNSSLKAALGVKIGTMIRAYTRGKTLQSANGTTINDYVEKQSSKRYFNSTRFAATARVGYGPFGLHASYQINRLLKDGVGPEIRPYSIGLVISGL
jgi:hypothetical protein